MEIRPARHDDFDAYCGLVAELDALHAKNAPRYYQVGSVPPRTREFFESSLANPDKAIFMAMEGSAIAGFIYLEARIEPAIPVLVPMRWANIYETVVAQKFQRRGVGKLLMDHARTWAKAKGCRDLRLSVFDFNESAQAFYRAEGFLVRNHIMALALD